MDPQSLPPADPESKLRSRQPYSAKQNQISHSYFWELQDNLHKKSPPKQKSPPRRVAQPSPDHAPRRPGRPPLKKYIRKALVKQHEEEEKIVDSCPHRVFELTETIESFIKDYVRRRTRVTAFQRLMAQQYPEHLKNKRICLYWDQDAVWYKGTFLSYNATRRMHRVLYDDRQEEWYHLSKERFMLETVSFSS